MANYFEPVSDLRPGEESGMLKEFFICNDVTVLHNVQHQVRRGASPANPVISEIRDFTGAVGFVLGDVEVQRAAQHT
jgi:hypothetical protein